MLTDTEIVDLVQGFEACTLPKPRWTHAAHLTVALWYLRRLPRDEATTQLRNRIQLYNRTIGGNPTGYHETVTLAWIEVITQFLAAEDKDQKQCDLTRRLIERCGDKDYLLSFYSRDRLLSEEARQTWLPPDLRPLGWAGDERLGLTPA